MSQLLKDTVELLDLVREKIVATPAADRQVFLAQEQKLLEKVDQLVPDPQSRKTNAAIGPAGK